MRRMTKASIGLAAIAAVAAARIVGAAQTPAAGPSCESAYVIGPEDVINISVFNNTDMSRIVPVRPDGRITLPLLNDVEAAGLTPMQLRDKLTRALAAYLASPNVSVIVSEIHSFKVTVIGEVKTPGRYELKSRATVLDALAMAGGTTEFASRGHITVMRDRNGETERIPFSYDKATRVPSRAAGDGGGNFCLKPGDIVVVP